MYQLHDTKNTNEQQQLSNKCSYTAKMFIEKTSEQHHQIPGHFISLEKSHTSYLQLITRLPDDAV